MNKLLLPALLSIMLAACGSTGTSTDGNAASVTDATAGAGVATVTAGGPTGSNIAALTDPSNILSRRNVFFDFDSYTVRAEFTPLIEAHGRFLAQNPEMRMMIQGNTDERGSREYNLALGQKRAEAVKQALMILGARESQVESVSLGEEKQRCYDATESCYAENRRADILYSGEF